MFTLDAINTDNKTDTYYNLCQQAGALMQGETNFIANAANFAALVFNALPDLNWAGFYLFDGQELVVGPFQGKPACIRIPLGKGVCGTAAKTGQAQLIADVVAHPNHIFCDSASRSEVVVPLNYEDGSLMGVWDVDSPIAARFDQQDLEGMEMLAQTFLAACAHAQEHLTPHHPQTIQR